jgi:DNA helicase-2/ATP-dependent DNA helicase PcrA
MTRVVAITSPDELREVMNAPYAVSEQQWLAISAPLEPAVVIAGAGSGKTSLMAARVVYLVATGAVAPDEVLGLTFTTKAASELAGRVREALVSAGLDRSAVDEEGAQERVEPMIATYHSFAAALLTDHGLRLGHEPDTRVMADASRYQLAARAIAGHRGTVTALTDSPSHAVDYLLALDAALSEHLTAPDDVRRFHDVERPRFEAAWESERAKKDIEGVLARMDQREELLALVEDYRRLKRRLGLMDFSDQIELAARLATEHPEVGAALRASYKIVLLDEYQDTSVAQATMLGRLFSGDSAAQGRGHPVTAVGDPNQAIYGWRGASVSNLIRFGHAFPRADGSPEIAAYPLTVNRRSDRRILDTANMLAAPLYAATETVAPLEPGEVAGLGRVETTVHRTLDEELAWVAQQILAARAASGAVPGFWREIGVLTRDNATAASAFDILSSHEIPVEIVGLQGLLRLPEVASVVATLTLLQDLTANAELLTLLTGPRWGIGPRDLAVLGRRARQLAGPAVSRRPEGLSVTDELALAVAGADPTEIVSLCDALDDPGEAREFVYSRAARERFGLLSTELRSLRQHVGEPLLDLVRRIIDTIGIDLELTSSVSATAGARRDNLDLFVQAVAEFQAIDGEVSLPALLAYLAAEDEMGTGLDIATPSEADSVKLLTVHRAKGLEWDTVFVVGVSADKFPSSRGRSQWTTGSWVLPAPLRGDAGDVPQLRGYDKVALEQLRVAARAHEATEELRLAYVALTRARHTLFVSSYLWAVSRAKPLGPSEYQVKVREAIESWGGEPLTWLECPEAGTPNPLYDAVATATWPIPATSAETMRRLEAAEIVRDVAVGRLVEPELDMVETALVAEWDGELTRLLAEVSRERADSIAVPLPPSLSATALQRLREDPRTFARELARPMPRPPSSSARFGTRFHAWVESRFEQQPLIDPDELSDRADVGIDSDEELTALIEAFEAGPFAERAPIRVEAPFALVVAGQVIRGRIDAVYREADGTDLVIDWKTNRHASADPLQLALYRLAWAELRGVPVAKVRAAFYYVRRSELVRHDDLPGRAEIESLIAGLAD